MTNPNDPAFPNEEAIEFIEIESRPGTKSPNKYGLTGGLTKREYFAGLAMQGYLSGQLTLETIRNVIEEGKLPQNIVANFAVNHADALIAELNKTDLK